MSGIGRSSTIKHMDRSKSSISHYFNVSQVLYSCCTSSSEYHRQLYHMFLHYIDWFPIVCFPFFDYIPLYIPYYPHIAISSIRNPHTIPLTLVMTTINLIYSLPANIKHYYVSIFHYNYVSLDSVWFIIIIAHCVYPAAFPYSMIYFHCWIIWTTLNNYIYIYIHIYIYICTYYDISIIQPTLSMQRASWSWFPALGKLKGRPVLVLWPWGPSETSDCTDGSWKFASWSQKTRRTTAWRFLWCTTSLPQWCITWAQVVCSQVSEGGAWSSGASPSAKAPEDQGSSPVSSCQGNMADFWTWHATNGIN